MSLEEDLRRSRDAEKATYLGCMSGLYADAVESNGEIYDRAAEATQNFESITPESVLADSTIIRVLRYCTAPSISQMKFGQLFGLRTIEPFEKVAVSPGGSRHAQLSAIAGRLASFVTDNLDSARFVWLSETLTKRERILASRYAKRWTCSLMSDQNAQTEYRNWRKRQQELAIARFIEESGYVLSAGRSTIESHLDLAVGEYRSEVKVRGRTTQKADLVVRSKRDKRLILIEAKAVGVELDSTKRIKECCDKANDWSTSKVLGRIQPVAVVAGFFTLTGVSNLESSGISVVWEHRLQDLTAFL